MNIGTLKKLIKDIPNKAEIEIPYKAMFGNKEFEFSPLFRLVRTEEDDDDEEKPLIIIQTHPIGLNEYMEREDSNTLIENKIDY